jgi:hypothetical protein
MIWKAKSVPETGDLKVVNRFAWLPKRVGKHMIWMEHYQMLYEYRKSKGPYCVVQGAWHLVDIKILV